MRSTESKAGMCMRSIHESVIGSEAKLQPYTVRLRASAVSHPHEALYDLGCQSTCNDLNAMRTEEFATVCRKDKPKRHFRRRSLYVLYVSPRGGTVCHPPCIMVTEWGAVKSGPSPEYIPTNMYAAAGRRAEPGGQDQDEVVGRSAVWESIRVATVRTRKALPAWPQRRLLYSTNQIAEAPLTTAF
jgi:hypothetical protein